MATHIIDGKDFSLKLCQHVIGQVEYLKQHHQVTPGLAVILVGDDPASQVYVRHKEKKSLEVGIASFVHRLGADVSEKELLSLISQLNDDPQVHGILCQLPVPEHIDEMTIIENISPLKDVDGFHSQNVASLVLGELKRVPCTPLGCLMMLRAQFPEGMSGMKAVVVGRSHIVGLPMAHLLLQENCTVSIVHSHTRDLQAQLKEADIVVAAVGRPEMIQGHWLNPQATVIDVGINRLASGKLVGDVHFAQALDRVKAITPVPGGVGPMTIACLLYNTLKSTYESLGLDFDDVSKHFKF